MYYTCIANVLYYHYTYTYAHERRVCCAYVALLPLLLLPPMLLLLPRSDCQLFSKTSFPHARLPFRFGAVESLFVCVNMFASSASLQTSIPYTREWIIRRLPRETCPPSFCFALPVEFNRVCWCTRQKPVREPASREPGDMRSSSISACIECTLALR